jgi:RNA polymerase sigma-70 factor, ECF subfamily
MRNAQQATTRDAEAFYAGTYPRLVGILALAAGNRADAEEVVQEAFVRLLPRWSKVSGYEDPEAWVRSVAFRLLSNRFRLSRNRAAAMARVAAPPPAPGPDAAAVDLRRALLELPLAQRQVVVLHYLLDRPVDAVAKDLGIASGTVKSRLSRARLTLGPLLSEDVNHNV